MDRRPEQTFLLRRNADNQQTHEKMINIANYQRNANQNYNEVASYTSQKNYLQKIYKQYMLERMWKKWTPLTLLVVIQTGTATIEKSMEVAEETKNISTI